MIFCCVNEKFFDKLCEERREILSLMKMISPEGFIERIRKLDKRLALKILTDNSHVKRLMIFETLQRFRFNELDAVRKTLKRNSLALANYLADDD